MKRMTMNDIEDINDGLKLSRADLTDDDVELIKTLIFEREKDLFAKEAALQELEKLRIAVDQKKNEIAELSRNIRSLTVNNIAKKFDTTHKVINRIESKTLLGRARVSFRKPVTKVMD